MHITSVVPQMWKPHQMKTLTTWGPGAPSSQVSGAQGLILVTVVTPPCVTSPSASQKLVYELIPDSKTLLPYRVSIYFLKLFSWLHQVLVAACKTFRSCSLKKCSLWTLPCSMWDLVPWPGIKPELPTSEVLVLTAGPPGKSSVQFSSVAQSCPTLCDPMNHSTPDLPVHHQLPESTQTHVHWVGNAIQPSHALSSPSLPVFNLSQHQGLFKWVSCLHKVAKVLEFQIQHQSLTWLLKKKKALLKSFGELWAFQGMSHRLLAWPYSKPISTPACNALACLFSHAHSGSAAP